MKRQLLVHLVLLLALVYGPVAAQARYLNPDTGRFQTMDSFEGSQTDPLSLHKYLYCHNDPCNYTDPSGLTENLAGQSATGGIIGYLGSSVSSVIGRATFSVYRTYAWVILNPLKAELALLLGSQVAAPIAVEALNEIADAMDAINKAADANAKQFSPGQFPRGFELEEVGGKALEQRGGQYLGGNVRGIDGTLGFDKNESLWQFKSHDLDEENLLKQINKTAEKLSKIDAQDIRGTTRSPAPGQPGQPYFRAAGSISAARVQVVFVPEGHARMTI